MSKSGKQEIDYDMNDYYDEMFKLIEGASPWTHVSMYPPPKNKFTKCKVCNEPFETNGYNCCSYDCASGG